MIAQHASSHLSAVVASSFLFIPVTTAWDCGVPGGPDHVWTYLLKLTTDGIELEYQPELVTTTILLGCKRTDRHQRIETLYRVVRN